MRVMTKVGNWLDRKHYNYCKREIKKLKEKDYKKMTDKDKKRLGELYADICTYELHEYRTKGTKFGNL